MGMVGVFIVTALATCCESVFTANAPHSLRTVLWWFQGRKELAALFT